MQRQNNAEGAPSNGTAVSTANSGAGSGDAWSSVAASGTRTFDNAHAHSGSYAYKLVTASGATNQVSWTGLSIAGTELWVRFYLYLTANPGVNTRIVDFKTAAAAECCFVNLTTTGTLTVNSNIGTALATSTNTISLNAWNRLEVYANFASAAGGGQIKCLLYKSGGDSYTLTEALDGAGNTNAPADQVLFGMLNSPAAVITAWFDDLIVQDYEPAQIASDGTHPIIGAASRKILLPTLAQTAAINRVSQW